MRGILLDESLPVDFRECGSAFSGEASLLSHSCFTHVWHHFLGCSRLFYESLSALSCLEVLRSAMGLTIRLWTGSALRSELPVPALRSGFVHISCTFWIIGTCHYMISGI